MLMGQNLVSVLWNFANRSVHGLGILMYSRGGVGGLSLRQIIGGGPVQPAS